MELKKLGWDEFFEKEFREYERKELIPARVIAEHKNRYFLYYEQGEINAQLAGKFRYKAAVKKDLPAVGDWVAVQVIERENKAVIHAVLPRKTSFVRKMPISGGRKMKYGNIVGGTPEEQVIASNIDFAFIVSGLDGNHNIQRLERYITLVYNSGADPVIILNKIDICSNPKEFIDEVQRVAIGIPIHAVGAEKGINMDVFDKYLEFGKTVVFLGSSGVGKSTISNYLLGAVRQQTKAVSKASGKGRHTTTSSELFFHDLGYMIIDTPGMRELQLWGEKEALQESFEDIVDLTNMCKFNNCRHESEPGCAILHAIEDGTITEERYDSYVKQFGELNRVSKMKKQAERYIGRMAKLNMYNSRNNAKKRK